MISPELPANVTLGQLGRRYRLVAPERWREMDEERRAAHDALSLHLYLRERQDEHPALEGSDCVFLSNGWMQGLLRAVGAPKTGEKAARAAIRLLIAEGTIEDTGRVKKPRRPVESSRRAERFQKQGKPEHEGGKDAQPTRERSFWWRVFRIPALTRIGQALKPQGAYAGGHSLSVPHYTASLSAFLRRQGLITRPRRGSRPRPGSVQWVFLHSGPP